jgi:hypothetical protein
MTRDPILRRKGQRAEWVLLRSLKAYGFSAEMKPLSGAAGGRFGDSALPLVDCDLSVEMKARAGGCRELYCWLNQRDVLIVKAKRRESIVVERLSLTAEISRLAA